MNPCRQPENLAIVTNWEGAAKAIVKTTKVEIVKFKDISASCAYIEGEGKKLGILEKSSLGILC